MRKVPTFVGASDAVVPAAARYYLYLFFAISLAERNSEEPREVKLRSGKGLRRQADHLEIFVSSYGRASVIA
jgi:hypothetical protein